MKVDVSDLPSKHTKDIETFRQVINITNPRDSMPVFSTSVWDLNQVAQKLELRSKVRLLLSDPCFEEKIAGTEYRLCKYFAFVLGPLEPLRVKVPFKVVKEFEQQVRQMI